MNTNYVQAGFISGVALVVLLSAGCNRQSRGNADAGNDNRAAAPAEGGGTSTKGSAGEAKNFGDTRTATEQVGRSPSASPTGLSQDTNAQHNVQTPGAGASTGQSQPVQSGQAKDSTAK
jgi:hypothetical protein